MNNQSARFDLNEQDFKKWLNNTLIFLAPAALIYLTAIQTGKSNDEAVIALQVWVLNTAIDLTRKFIAGTEAK